MAECEAAVRGTGDGGEGTGARIVGGSLPPRKRLLAGLKQNGLWGGSSGPGSATAEAPVHRPDGGEGTAVAGSALLRNSPSYGVAAAAAAGDGKGGCVGCGALESDAWKKTKRGGGGVSRVCEVCNLSSHNESVNSCPRCQAVCPEVKDPAVWLECSRCQRFVHLECEPRSPPLAGEGAYVCSDCLDVKKDEEHVDAVQSTAVVSGSSSLKSDAEGETCALPATTELPTPCNKKPRVLRESRSKSNDVEPGESGNLEEIPSGAKALLGGKVASSKQAAAAAAAATAAVASRAAATAAKASAVAKAAAAVRAAAAAKAALDAAALAARVESQGRVELRRSSVSFKRTHVADGQVDGALSQLKREKPDVTHVKTEGVEIPAVPNSSSIDDEELARQLHRAINSSPRISSGLTPQRRKPLTKPAATVNTSHAVTSWPRLGSSTESETRLQNKQQQTRSRSIQLKEVKRIDGRDVKLESKPSGGNGRNEVPQQPHCAVASGSVTEALALKSEPADSSTITLVIQDSGNMPHHDATSVPLNVASKTDTDNRMNGATEVICDVDDSQDRVRAGTDSNVSQAAALLDEVLMSEVDEDEASKEEYLSRLQDRENVHLKDLPASTTNIVEDAVLRTHPQPSEEARESTEVADMANVNMSGVAALVQVATSAIELLETQDTSSSAAVLDGACSTGGEDNSLEDASAAEKSGELAVKVSLATIPSVSSKASSDFEPSSASKSSPPPPVSGKECDQGTLTGTPRSGLAVKQS